MRTVVLVKDRKKNSMLQFVTPDLMPPNMMYIGIHTSPFGKKYKMYGFGEASPKWKKLKCS